MGAIIHMTITRPAMTFMAAQNGTKSGDPTYVICAQSKVIGNRPKPEVTPNRFATTTFLGANHVTTLK